MKAYVKISFEVELPKDLEYLKDVDWGDEDIGLSLTGAQIEDADNDNKIRYEPAVLTLSKGLDPLHDLEMLELTIDDVIVE